MWGVGILLGLSGGSLGSLGALWRAAPYRVHEWLSVAAWGCLRAASGLPGAAWACLGLPGAAWGCLRAAFQRGGGEAISEKLWFNYCPRVLCLTTVRDGDAGCLKYYVS